MNGKMGFFVVAAVCGALTATSNGQAVIPVGGGRVVTPGSASPIEPRVVIDTECLKIIGTDDDDIIALRLHPIASVILEVDFDNDAVPDLFYHRDNFRCIMIDGRGGDDTIFIDESSGVFTNNETTTILGGPGNDTIVGGSGGETYYGGGGNDTILASGGADRIVWNPGDGNEFVEAGDGIDRVEINGGPASEQFTITANGTRVRFDQLSPVPSFLDLGGCENLELNCSAGDDSLACTGNLAALIHIAVHGGAGDDQLLGSNGGDLLDGGAGDDFIDGQQGNDSILLGSGDDVFQWDPGDGSDAIDGQGGHDTIVLNGSAGSETFDFSANGQRLRFARNLGNIVLDVGGIEQFDLRALGGTDLVAVNDLRGTGLDELNIDFAGLIGGSSGDSQFDQVTIVGTAGAETFDFHAEENEVVTHLPTSVRVRGYEPSDQVLVQGAGGDIVRVDSTDGADVVSVTANGTQARVDVSGYSAAVAVTGQASLEIDCLGGDDHASCVGNLAAIVPITINGGDGDDTLLGSNGADLLIGGAGADFIDGQQGADTVHMGDGDDVFQWDPGDGSDIVEGEGGHDAVRFNGSNIGEVFNLSANAGRLRFTRNIAAITLDADGVEEFDLRCVGGVDSVTVDDLSATALTDINFDLASVIGGNDGDSQADTVTLNGTSTADAIQIASQAGAVLVTGLKAVLRISHSEALLDLLVINGMGGADTFEALPEAFELISITTNQ